MPTTIIKYVDPDNSPGTDYTSLQAAIADQLSVRPNLVANDEILEFHCKSSAGSPDIVTGSDALFISGFTTDSTHYIKIVGDRDGPAWDNSKYHIRGVAQKTVFNVSVPYTVFERLQIELFEPTGGDSGIYATAEILIDKCMIRLTGPSTDGRAVTIKGPDIKIINTVIFDFNSNSTDRGIYNAAGYKYYLYNCTIVNVSDFGARTSSNYGVAKNTLTYNCGSGFDDPNDWDSSSDYNIANDNSAPGPNSINNATGVIFTDETNKDFSLATGSIGIDQGMDLSNDPVYPVTEDFLGNPRPAGAGWDIGAFEYGAGGPALVEFDARIGSSESVQSTVSLKKSIDSDVVSPTNARADISKKLSLSTEITSTVSVETYLPLKKGAQSEIASKTGTLSTSGNIKSVFANVSAATKSSSDANLLKFVASEAISDTKTLPTAGKIADFSFLVVQSSKISAEPSEKSGVFTKIASKTALEPVLSSKKAVYTQIAAPSKLENTLSVELFASIQASTGSKVDLVAGKIAAAAVESTSVSNIFADSSKKVGILSDFSAKSTVLSQTELVLGSQGLVLSKSDASASPNNLKNIAISISTGSQIAGRADVYRYLKATISSKGSAEGFLVEKSGIKAEISTKSAVSATEKTIKYLYFSASSGSTISAVVSEESNIAAISSQKTKLDNILSVTRWASSGFSAHTTTNANASAIKDIAVNVVSATKTIESIGVDIAVNGIAISASKTISDLSRYVDVKSLTLGGANVAASASLVKNNPLSAGSDTFLNALPGSYKNIPTEAASKTTSAADASRFIFTDIQVASKTQSVALVSELSDIHLSISSTTGIDLKPGNIKDVASAAALSVTVSAEAERIIDIYANAVSATRFEAVRSEQSHIFATVSSQSSCVAGADKIAFAQTQVTSASGADIEQGHYKAVEAEARALGEVSEGVDALRNTFIESKATSSALAESGSYKDVSVFVASKSGFEVVRSESSYIETSLSVQSRVGVQLGVIAATQINSDGVSAVRAETELLKGAETSISSSASHDGKLSAYKDVSFDIRSNAAMHLLGDNFIDIRATIKVASAAEDSISVLRAQQVSAIAKTGIENVVQILLDTKTNIATRSALLPVIDSVKNIDSSIRSTSGALAEPEKIVGVFATVTATMTATGSATALRNAFLSEKIQSTVEPLPLNVKYILGKIASRSFVSAVQTESTYIAATARSLITAISDLSSKKYIESLFVGKTTALPAPVVRKEIDFTAKSGTSLKAEVLRYVDVRADIVANTALVAERTESSYIETVITSAQSVAAQALIYKNLALSASSKSDIVALAEKSANTSANIAAKTDSTAIAGSEKNVYAEIKAVTRLKPITGEFSGAFFNIKSLSKTETIASGRKYIAADSIATARVAAANAISKYVATGASSNAEVLASAGNFKNIETSVESRSAFRFERSEFSSITVSVTSSAKISVIEETVKNSETAVSSGSQVSFESYSAKNVFVEARSLSKLPTSVENIKNIETAIVSKSVISFERGELSGISVEIASASKALAVTAVDKNSESAVSAKTTVVSDNNAYKNSYAAIKSESDATAIAASEKNVDIHISTNSSVAVGTSTFSDTFVSISAFGKFLPVPSNTKQVQAKTTGTTGATAIVGAEKNLQLNVAAKSAIALGLQRNVYLSADVISKTSVAASQLLSSDESETVISSKTVVEAGLGRYVDIFSEAKSVGKGVAEPNRLVLFFINYESELRFRAYLSIDRDVLVIHDEEEYEDAAIEKISITANNIGWRTISWVYSGIGGDVPGGDKVEILRSPTGRSGSYEVVANVDITQESYVDTINATYKNEVYFYKIRHLGREYGPVMITAKSDEMSNAVTNLLSRALNRNLGTSCLLFPKKTSGERCPDCWDEILGRCTDGDCYTCKGTGWVDGYHEPQNILVSFPKEAQTLINTDVGSMSPQRIEGAWTLAFPVVNPGDVIVRLYDKKVWRVESPVLQSQKHQKVLRQILTLTDISETEIEHTLNF
jgi:hypothetical protein